MYRHKCKFVFLTVALLISVNQLSASSDIAVSAGVCKFEYRGEGEESLVSGIASRFFEAVSGIAFHKAGAEELSVILSEEKAKQINDAILAIEKLYLEKDQLLFNAENIDDLNIKLEEKILVIQAKKNELENIKQEKNEISGTLSEDDTILLTLTVKSPEDGLVFARAPGAIAESADEFGLDFTVYGFVETIDEYEYIEVRLWNNIIRKDSVIWRTAVDAENVNDLIVPGINEVKTAILGRDWGELTILAPDNSMIYIDDVFTGIGSMNRMLLSPGEVDIEIRKPGRESFFDTVEVESLKLTEKKYELEEIKMNTVIVQTWPADADIYLDSVWAGESPIRLESQSTKSAVRISRDGYEDRKFIISQDTENILNFNLKPENSGRNEFVPDSRKRFYTSMGSFILSIPLTSIFSSLMDQSASAYNREYQLNGTLNRTELYRLYNLNRAQYSLYLASTGLNVFLFLDTIIQAVDYVTSVEYFSN